MLESAIKIDEIWFEISNSSSSVLKTKVPERENPTFGDFSDKPFYLLRYCHGR
jgi:hypothetical protein